MCVLGAKLPVEAVAKIGKVSVSVDSTATVILVAFEDGDALTFFTGQNSADHSNLSRILIAKIG